MGRAESGPEFCVNLGSGRVTSLVGRVKKTGPTSNSDYTSWQLCIIYVILRISVPMPYSQELVKFWEKYVDTRCSNFLIWLLCLFDVLSFRGE